MLFGKDYIQIACNNGNPVFNKYWIGAAITAAGAIGAAILGKNSNSNANKANLQATRETNALNYKMFQEQNAYNEYMWNLQNQYNTPSAQRERYEEAGINPYFALSNIDSGNAESLLSAQPNSAQVGNAQKGYDYSPLSQGISQTVDAFLAEKQADNIQTDTAQKKVDLSWSERFKALDFAKEMSESRSVQLRNIGQEIQNNLALSTFNDLEKQTKEKTIQSQIQTTYMRLQVANQDIENQIRSFYKDNIQPFELQKMINEINSIFAQTRYVTDKNVRENRLTDAEIKGIYADILLKGKQGELIDNQKDLVSSQTESQNIQNSAQSFPTKVGSSKGKNIFMPLATAILQEQYKVAHKQGSVAFSTDTDGWNLLEGVKQAFPKIPIMPLPIVP